jgi:hypothetical protein
MLGFMMYRRHEKAQEKWAQEIGQEDEVGI